VRKRSGFTFYGETTSQSYVIGDIEVLEGLDREVNLLTATFNSHADQFPRDGSSVERLARRCAYRSPVFAKVVTSQQDISLCWGRQNIQIYVSFVYGRRLESSKGFFQPRGVD
jgi:hypothetical protein